MGRILLPLVVLLFVGCTNGSRGDAPGVVVLVPGVAGDGAWYGHVVPALRAAGDRRTVESFGWGAPGPMFFLNFTNESIHDAAERALATRLVDLRRRWPGAPIDVIAHSAGGGVTLGALARLPAETRVRNVVLLNPSVSPAYRLDEPLAHVEGTLHAFSSDRDSLYLAWRSTNFGTYDNLHMAAAGNVGFRLDPLPARLRSRVASHAYDATADASLGNDGGHFGALARPFLERRVAPLLVAPTPRDVTASSAPPR